MTEKKKKDVIVGKTKSGFAYTIPKAALNNFELLDYFADLDENPFLLPKLIKILLGEDQKKALYDHVRIEDGTVPMDKIEAELSEIFELTGDIKN
ncbi:hypothetical protein HMPREF9130_1240 [Peptoniphilus sp. oral taxon 375 str. F0436]|nr:hypothetical protein HMPREF9130_1240 [Peptoniphilus sp. oral taxon 375 str. F0436]